MIKFSEIEPFKECSQTSNKKVVWIHDSPIEPKVCKFTSEKEGQITIVNKKRKKLHLLQIDNCHLKAQDGEKCDCAISTNIELFFIEFKEKLNFEDNKGKRKIVKKAMNQLAATIKKFKPHNIHLNNTFAIVALTPIIPHEYREIVTVGKQNDIAFFVSKTGCANIMTGNILHIKK